MAVTIIRARPPLSNDVLELPDGQHWSRPRAKIVSYSIHGQRVLVVATAAPGRMQLAAIALDKEEFFKHFRSYKGLPNARVSMSANVRAGTDLGILDDELEAFITPTGQRCRVHGIPFRVLEVEDGFAVIVRRRRDAPDRERNIFMYDRVGRLRWQVGCTPSGEALYFSSMYCDQQGRLIGGWDIHIAEAWVIDPESGKLTEEIRSPQAALEK